MEEEKEEEEEVVVQCRSPTAQRTEMRKRPKSGTNSSPGEEEVAVEDEGVVVEGAATAVAE